MQAIHPAAPMRARLADLASEDRAFNGGGCTDQAGQSHSFVFSEDEEDAG